MIRMKLFNRIDEQNDYLINEVEGSIYTAYDDNGPIGYCVFTYHEEMVILKALLTAPKDIAVADGLARATIAAAQLRQKTRVRVEETKNDSTNTSELQEFVESLDVFLDNEASIQDVLSATACKQTS
ncbi:MAG: hypothetical protein FWG21_01860 [Oscillospiraceae bacterium]|nr:hypothetical protein [Oscillospiraceae bacterium]